MKPTPLGEFVTVYFVYSSHSRLAHPVFPPSLVNLLVYVKPSAAFGHSFLSASFHWGCQCLRGGHQV